MKVVLQRPRASQWRRAWHACFLGAAIGSLSALSGQNAGRPPPSVFPGKTWLERAPAEVGLDARALDTFAANVGGDGCIIRDGYLVKTWGDRSTHKWWASATKPVFSTLLLCAVQEGRLPSVDAPVKSAGWALAAKDAAMTFRQLANMTSGYACVEPPGAAWGYNDFAIQLYARSLEKIFGLSLADAFATRFAALQFEDRAVFGHRNNLGVVASPRDFARIGWLWLNHGRWNGRALIERELFDACIVAQVPANLPRTITTSDTTDDYLRIGSFGGGTNQTPHGPGVYGFNFWFNAITSNGQRVWPAAPPDTYQANGLWNRDTLTIIPSLRLVIASRGAQPGKFEPAIAESVYHQNLKLIIDAARVR
jgi:CubicO group peptidase (beta-lactamase class C family)